MVRSFFIAVASFGKDDVVKDSLGLDLNEALMVISDIVMVMEEGERCVFLFCSSDRFFFRE